MSRVVRTARTTQEKHERGTRRACILESHTCDAFPATIQELDEDEISHKTQQHRIIRKMKQNSPCPNHCRHGGRFRRFMKTWDTQQIGRSYECCVSVEPSADSSWQPPGTGVVLEKRPACPIVSRSPTFFVFNDVVDLTCSS